MPFLTISQFPKATRVTNVARNFANCDGPVQASTPHARFTIDQVDTMLRVRATAAAERPLTEFDARQWVRMILARRRIQGLSMPISRRADSRLFGVWIRCWRVPLTSADEPTGDGQAHERVLDIGLGMVSRQRANDSLLRLRPTVSQQIQNGWCRLRDHGVDVARRHVADWHGGPVLFASTLEDGSAA